MAQIKHSRLSVSLIISVFAFPILLSSCLSVVKEKQETYGAPYYLQHENITVGILPSVGGLVVYLADETGENMLLSDSSLWFEEADRLPRMGSHYNPRLYNGHTVWLGPQTAWWAQQNVDPSLTRTRAQWPPDPYLAFGRYTIVASSDSSVCLQSPRSPFSGVQMTKEIMISAPGKLRFIATIRNIREEPVSWDIWMNTRLDGKARVYVPVAGIQNIKRVSAGQGKNSQAISYISKDGYISFVPQFPGPDKKNRFTKLYLYPEAPWIAAFTKNHLFIKRFHSHPEASIHPEQALVELYNCMSTDPGECVLELEHHGPYKELQPGEQLSESEEWELLPYHGSREISAEIEFLNEKTGKN
ncbi:MAG: DUF4380 domain-containing protein [Bacteroidales bacterium]